MRNNIKTVLFTINVDSFLIGKDLTRPVREYYSSVLVSGTLLSLELHYFGNERYLKVNGFGDVSEYRIQIVNTDAGYHFICPCCGSLHKSLYLIGAGKFQCENAYFEESIGIHRYSNL